MTSIPKPTRIRTAIVVGQSHPLFAPPDYLETASGVYVIRNLVTGCVYVGSSQDIRTRWNAHRSTLQQKGHGCAALQKQFDEYGPTVFTFKTVEICDRRRLLKREAAWMYGAYKADPLKLLNSDIRLIAPLRSGPQTITI